MIRVVLPVPLCTLTRAGREVRLEVAGRATSHDPPDTPLPAAVATGVEPFLIVGALAGG